MGFKREERDTMVKNEVIDLLMDHRSIRQYEEKPIPEEVVETILRCAQMAPTSSYLQAYSIIRVNDPEKREALKKASGGQQWVTDAPLALLFCADLHRCDKFLPIVDQNVLHNHELFTVAVADTALAAQKAFIAAQALGLGGVVVGGVRNDMEAMAKAFDLPSLVYPMFLLCLGYPDQHLPQRPRMPLRFVAGKDAYPEVTDLEAMEAYDKQVSDYFNELTNGEDTFGWISRSNHALELKPRYAVGEFLRDAGFTTKTEPAK
jgi:nitroreductase/FMN reductase (NADPH)